ncbi:MAG: triose-phosphate isomerase [Clostridia bacterium]
MRKKIIIGNWKMNYSVNVAENFLNDIKDSINTNEVDVVICPNFTCLDRISNLIDNTNISLGAQNVYFENSGAFTGEISADMLNGLDVNYCIVGHSERRNIFNETDDIVNKKVIKLLKSNITPILCVGENLNDRNNSDHFSVVYNQLKNSLKDITDISNVVIAYEPIWAIGTGVSASEIDANDMCKYIRESISKMYDTNIANNIRIVYGGSVKASNAKLLLNMDNIDGALVGGACITNEFVAIVNY